MAYMNQARKRIIAAALKNIVPAGWKYSLSVYHHSTLVLTVQSAPVDVLGHYFRNTGNVRADYVDVNTHHAEKQFKGDLLGTVRAILDAMNAGNHDRSDLMTDYFDVGWYVDVRFGRWDKPFICTLA